MPHMEIPNQKGTRMVETRSECSSCYSPYNRRKPEFFKEKDSRGNWKGFRHITQEMQNKIVSHDPSLSQKCIVGTIICNSCRNKFLPVRSKRPLETDEVIMGMARKKVAEEESRMKEQDKNNDKGIQLSLTVEINKSYDGIQGMVNWPAQKWKEQESLWTGNY